MGRPKTLEASLVISTRLERNTYSMLNDIAALETMNTGRQVTVQELIRNAIHFVYSDNERLRECFRRSKFYTRKQK